GEPAEDVSTVSDALALLDATRTERPRCYGESWTAGTKATEPVAAVEPEPPAAAASPGSASGAGAADSGAHSTPQTARADAGARGPAMWSIEWISRVSVRMELGTLSWVDNETGLLLDVTVVNSLPRPVALHSLQVAHIGADGMLLGVWGGRRENTLSALEG